MSAPGRPFGSTGIRVFREGRWVSPRTLSDNERFMCYVEKTAECWNWVGTKSRKGYGRFSHKARAVSAHRYSYEAFIGPIPDGLEIDHLCRNRSCVNPGHLEPVDHRENVLRSPSSIPNLARDRQDCPQGHPLDGLEWVKSRGAYKRYCKTCKRSRALARYHAKKVSA